MVMGFIHGTYPSGNSAYIVVPFNIDIDRVPKKPTCGVVFFTIGAEVQPRKASGKVAPLYIAVDEA